MQYMFLNYTFNNYNYDITKWLFAYSVYADIFLSAYSVYADNFLSEYSVQIFGNIRF